MTYPKKMITNAKDLRVIACTSIEEQETTINVNRSEDRMIIFTSDNTMLTKLKKKAFLLATDDVEGGGQIRQDWKCWEGSPNVDGEPTGYFFSAPKQLLSFRSEQRAERELTDEQREVLRNRMKQIRNK
mgnify:CR=1 FL=1